MRIGRWVLAVAMAWMCASCSRTAPGERPSGEALLLLTIDTLRSDRLGCYGDARARTPHLDRLARSGTQWATALAHAPLTLPSHTTILSGVIPPEHGVRDNGLYRVPGSLRLLPEVLGGAGWKTAAFVAAHPLAARYGLHRGFDLYREPHGSPGDGASGAVERRAESVVDEVADYVASEWSGDRRFVWAHFFDPHAPHDPPKAYRDAHPRDPYRGEVTYADAQTGRLLRILQSSAKTLRVCVTADHGESLGQHDESTHGVFVYEATTRVPLILAGPGVVPGTTIHTATGVRGVAAALTDWAGIALPPEFGAPLPRTGDSPGRGEPVFVESAYPLLRHGWAPPRGLRGERWKVIHAPRPEVYDLYADPGETRNLHGSADLPSRPQELLAMLAGPEWSVTLPASAPDAESEAALRSLGYAGAHPLPDAPGDSLPDAKDRVRIESYLSRAGSALEAGRAASARRALSSALGLDSRNKEAHLLLARVQAATGEVSRALETFRWCLSLPPASMNALVYYEAARVTLDAGLLDEAADFSRRACRIDPRHMEARFNWGVTAFRQDRPGEAAMHWEEVLRMDPEHPEASRWLPEARAMAAGRGDRE